MQKLAKIRPSRSSEVNSPVISARHVLGLTQFFGHQLAGAAFGELAFGLVQMRVRACKRVEMPASRGNRARVRAVKANAFLQMLAQQIHAFACRCGQMDAWRRGLLIACACAGRIDLVDHERDGRVRAAGSRSPRCSDSSSSMPGRIDDVQDAIGAASFPVERDGCLRPRQYRLPRADRRCRRRAAACRRCGCARAAHRASYPEYR